MGGLFLRAGHHFASAYHFPNNLTEEGGMLEPNVSFTLNDIFIFKLFWLTS